MADLSNDFLKFLISFIGREEIKNLTEKKNQRRNFRSGAVYYQIFVVFISFCIFLPAGEFINLS